MRAGDWLLTPGRFAVHEPTRTAVVADLHLGYERVRRRGGEAVPGRHLRVELAPLGEHLRRAGVSRLVVAGDLFEDGRHQREEMASELLAWLAEAGFELAGVVPGNHDRGLGGTALPVFREGMALGRWRVVHGDAARPAGCVVQGHEHPWMRWEAGIEGPCYLLAEDHLIVPAWSRDAAGVNVLGQERFGGYRCCVIAGEQVLDFGTVRELQEARRRR